MRIQVNRAPVLTLWAAIVAERLGHDRATALTLGKAVAGYAAYAKAKSLGLAEESRDTPAERRASEKAKPETAEVMGKRIPITKTKDGPRALDADGKPLNPASVEKYLAAKFGDGLDEARAAMTELAKSMTEPELRSQGFTLYEQFRPPVPEGVKGWGATGVLDTDAIRKARAPKARRGA
jgi:hypothetical protein